MASCCTHGLLLYTRILVLNPLFAVFVRMHDETEEHFVNTLPLLKCDWGIGYWNFLVWIPRYDAQLVETWIHQCGTFS